VKTSYYINSDFYNPQDIQPVMPLLLSPNWINLSLVPWQFKDHKLMSYLLTIMTTENFPAWYSSTWLWRRFMFQSSYHQIFYYLTTSVHSLDLTLYGLVISSLHSGGACCLYFQGTPRIFLPITNQQGIVSQKTKILINRSVETSNHTFYFIFSIGEGSS
jgi:hypothetical protein